MQFNKFSNPENYSFLYKNFEHNLQESNNTQAVSEETEYRDNGKAIIINQYNPDKPISEDGVGWTKVMNEVVKNYMDFKDYHTLNVISVMNEEQQNSLLVSLTNKLYKTIVDKIDSVDYGEIPSTKGDITKLHKYKELCECLDVLKNIFEQYHEDKKPVLEIENAITNVEDLKDIFVSGFATKTDLAIHMYNNIVLSIISSTSYMIAVCIEYIKNPKTEGLQIVMRKTGVSKVKESLVYESLANFNESCRKNEVENALRPLIQQKMKGFVGTIAFGVKFALVLGGVLLALIPMIRNLTYFFYAARTRVSNYFDLQAKLLEMNAEELKNNPNIKTVEDKEQVIRKQLAIAQTFHNIANNIAVEVKDSEIEATKEIKKDKTEYRIDEIEPQTKEDDGPLF